MYIVIDRVTPTITSYLTGLKAKNTVLRYWPTRLQDGVEVMDRLYVYAGGSVKETIAHKKIYNLLNMDVEELKSSDWSGVESYWLYFRRDESGGYFIFLQDLKDFIDNAIPLNQTITNTFSYEAIVTETPLTNAQVIARLTTTPLDYVSNIKFDLSKVNPMLSAIFFDSDGELFEKSYKVINQRITEDQYRPTLLLQPDSSSSKKIIYNIEVTYKRIAEVTNPIVEDSIVAIQTYLGDLDSGTLPASRYDAYQKSSKVGGIHAQLKNMYEDSVVLPESDTNLVFTRIPEYPWMSNKGYSTKKSGIEAMKVKTFKTFIGQSLDTDYKEEEAEWWEKVLAIIIAIVIVVVSAGAGAAAVTAGMTSAQALFAFAVAASMVLSLGLLAIGLLAYLAVAAGNYGAAFFLQGTMQVLGVISQALGIIASIGSFITQFAQQGLKQLTKDGLLDTIENLFIKLEKQFTQDILGSMTKFLSGAFDLYQKYIDPPNEGLAKMQETTNQQQEELEDYTSPESLKKMQVLFESPHANIYDFNEYMQNIPWLMTEGKVVGATTKYYS